MVDATSQSWVTIEEQQEDYFSFEETLASSDSEDEDNKSNEARRQDKDEDSDVDADIAHAHGPNTTSERRRAQNERKSAMLPQGLPTKSSFRSAISWQNKMAPLASRTHDDYQTELFQRAKSENVIAVLDTGSGKTHIATLLLRHVLDGELEYRAAGGIPKIAFFLVDSVNLVFQQANVLRCGLDQSVEGICGAMGASLWSKSTWESHFQSNMVIINLLIFDEAHHAKGNHPYARLMKDYYVHEPKLSNRPRIFGMTASPIDTRGLSIDHIRNVANDLEKLLHSKIVTTSESVLASNSISRPIEEIAVYERLQDECETPLHQKIKAKFGDISAFKKLFIASKHHGSELGRWASDMYWSFAFTDEQSRKLEDREHLKHNKIKQDGAAQEWDAQSKRLQEAATFVQQFDFGSCALSDEDLSSKVLKLRHWLNLYYERDDGARCIVFVTQRQTARLLELIFSQIGGPNLRCSVLVGVNNRVGEHNISLRNQILTVAKFRRGELNCLFATSVAEEGLDIPQCNLVVRFDLYRTMIAYVQSRGRARHRNSRYLHMVEAGNEDHQSRVLDVKSDEDTMRRYCKALPQDRQIGGNDVDLLCVRRQDSLSVLNHFVATLPGPDRQTMLQPTYSFTGDIQSKKATAKCSAAFKACLKLYNKGYLSENLLPTTHKSLPAGTNALLALSEKKKGMYSMLIKPESIWKIGRGVVPLRVFYLTLIDLDAGLDRPHQPMGLLTRNPLPQMPNFPIYLTDCRPSNVISQSSQTPLYVSAETIDILTGFTLRIYEDVYNKKYENDAKKMSYWVVPILPGKMSSPLSVTALDQILDMEQVHRVYNEPMWRWTPKTISKDLLDRYFVDPMNGGRRYYSNHLATQLKPQDPGYLEVNQSQPVLEVEKIPFRRNHLARVEEKEKGELDDLKTYICPEPLHVSNLATPFVVVCYVLPAIIHRFESYLIALDACKTLDLDISPALALEALTKDSDNSEEHGEEKINFKSGMGPNYERLEFLGDCFLKMATSLSVFVQQPDENEFEFHVRLGKKKRISADGAEALDIQLYGYIRTDSFSRRTWYPEGLKLLKGKGLNKTEDDWLKLTHNLGR
ncbi:unnamed protein product [Alternaria alternata]